MYTDNLMLGMRLRSIELLDKLALHLFGKDGLVWARNGEGSNLLVAPFERQHAFARDEQRISICIHVNFPCIRCIPSLTVYAS